MKKNKGFTLIELLAVIVILAIIALIATPIITGQLDQVRASAFLRSANSIVHAAELKYATGRNEATEPSANYDVVYANSSLVGTNNINYKGARPDDGLISIDPYGKILIALWNDTLKKCAVKGYDEDEAKYVAGISSKTTCLTQTSGVVVVVYQQVVDTNPGVICGSTAVEDYAGNAVCNINSVEDLVAFSSLAKTQTFSGKTVNLNTNLDISDDVSYINPLATTFGDINGNATTESLKIELTTAKGFYPIGINTVAFAGIFNGNAKIINHLYINRPIQNYVGLFGYVTTSGIVKGFTLDNLSVVGASNTGGAVGWTNGLTTAIDVSGNVTGTSNVGLANGHGDNNYSLKNIIVEGNVIGAGSYVGGIIGSNYNGNTIGVIYKGGSVTNSTGANRISNYNSPSNALANKTILINGATVTSSSLTSADGKDMDLALLNDLNILETIGIDTYIGGDNDGDGYFFDYNSSGEIVLKAASDAIFALSGNGTTLDPYLITNYSDLKQVSLRLAAVFKLTNSIDLTGKKTYMLSSNSNRFSGTFNGNAKTISNININGFNYTGLFGYVTTVGVVKGFNLNNLSVVGALYTGGVVGWNDGAISSIDVVGNVTGTDNVGLINGYGYNNNFLKNAIVEGNVVGTGPYVAGVVGYNLNANTIGIINMGGTITGDANATRISVLNSAYNALANKTILVNGATVTSTSTTSGNGKDMDIALLSDLNVLETTGLDTYIGGDNDGDGYYFDYNSSGEIVIKVASDAVFSLSGTGTALDPYLIANDSDLKQVSLRPTSTFKLTNSIDLTGKKTYMLASNSNRFSGTFNGNAKTISNININGLDYTALFGYSTGTIKGILINNLTVSGLNYSAGLVGYSSTGTLADIYLSGNVTGVNYSSLVAGYFLGSISRVVFEGNLVGAGGYVSGLVSFNNGGGVVNGVVNRSGSISNNAGSYRISGLNSSTNARANQTILVRGATVTETSLLSQNGKDTTPADLLLQATYTGIGFNFTDTTPGTYKWQLSGSNIWFEAN